MKWLKCAALASSAVLTLAAAGPAAAASFVTVDGLNGSVTLDGSDTSDFEFQVDYLGFGGDPAMDLDQLTATIDFVFTGVSNDGKTFNFGFDISNSSSVLSRLTAFGFSVDPDVAGATSTGQFDISIVNPTGTVPNFGPIEVCFKDAGNPNNCSGAKNGVYNGSTATGTFALLFNTAPGTITLDRFVVRYQGISGVDALEDPDGSAIGRGMVVPEPAAWAMMIAGFGLMGAAVRSRRVRSPATA